MSGEASEALVNLALREVEEWEGELDHVKVKYLDKKNAESSQLNYNVMERFAKSISAHEIIISPTAQTNQGLYLPPSGYVASIHSQRKFNIQLLDENIFRGSLFFQLPSSFTKLKDDSARKLIEKLNLLLPDQSPLPFRPNSGDWLPSLGPFAWAGLYEERSTTGDDSYWLICISGLDHQVYLELHDYALNNWDDKITVEEFFTLIQPWKEYAAENRKRILGLLLYLLGETSSLTYATGPSELDATLEEEGPLLEEMKDWWDEELLGMPLQPWYKFPQTEINFTLKKLPLEWLGKRIGVWSTDALGIPTLPGGTDYVLTDFVCEGENLKKYSACQIFSARSKELPYLAGPLRNIILVDGVVGQLHPSQGNFLERNKPQKTATIYGWETMEVKENLMVNSDFFWMTPESGRVVRKFNPLFLRISEMDYTRTRIRDPFPGRFDFFCF